MHTAAIREKPAAAAAPRAALFRRKCACGKSPGLGGECEECGGNKGLQQKRVGALEHSAVPPIVDEVLRSPGRPLDPQTRAFAESRLGHSFSHVRVHAGARAAESARAVHALAYTVGNDVVFGAGRYAPHNSEGRKLLAHELSHVVQQTSLRGSPAPGSAALAEAEADRNAEAVNSSQATRTGLSVAGGTLQRQADGDAASDVMEVSEPERQDTTPAAAPSCPCNPPILKGESCKDKGRDKPVMDAFTKGAGWLPNAQQRIENFINDPKSEPLVDKALTDHFSVASGSSGATAVAQQILGVIKRTTTNITNPICPHCPDTCSSEAKDATKVAAISPNAWKKTNCYTFCPTFFTLDATTQGKVALHEMMHSWERMGDAVYEGDPGYPPSTQVAKVTADCHAALIRDLG